MLSTDFFKFCIEIYNKINASNISKLQKNIDGFLESINKDNKKNPLLLNDNSELVHTKSPRYSNGELITNFIEEDSLTEGQKEQAKNLSELYNTYTEECIYILNHLKQVAMNVILLTDLEYDQAVQILLNVLPDFFRKDINLFYSLIPKDYKQAKDILENKIEYHAKFLSDEAMNEFIDGIRNQKVNDLLEKYYALGLLNNF